DRYPIEGDVPERADDPQDVGGAECRGVDDAVELNVDRVRGGVLDQVVGGLRLAGDAGRDQARARNHDRERCGRVRELEGIRLRGRDGESVRGLHVAGADHGRRLVLNAVSVLVNEVVVRGREGGRHALDDQGPRVEDADVAGRFVGNAELPGAGRVGGEELGEPLGWAHGNVGVWRA